MLGDLIAAMKVLYDSAGATAVALRAATTGGLWLSEAPQNASGVYLVLTPVVAPMSYVMSKDYTQDCDMQFSVATLSGTATNVVDAMKALVALYDFCSLSITNHTLLVARRLSCQGPLRDDMTGGYIGYVEYRFTIGG